MKQVACPNVVLLIACTGLPAASGARAQENAAREAPPPGLRADATYSDVYVNDSFEAADAVGRARTLADRGRWGEAAELLQQTLDSAGDKVIRVGPGRYVGIQDHINGIIAGWPRAGIEAYQDLYERDMEAAVSSLTPARTTSELLSLFHRYFCTTQAAALADTVGQLAIESGDLALAEHVYRCVLERHPDRTRYSSSYRGMLSLIAAMRGEEMKGGGDGDGDGEGEGNAGAVIRWMGQERRLHDVLAEVREGFAVLRRQPSPDEWPMFAGNTDRNRKPSTTVDELGLLWRAEPFERRDAERDAGRDAEDGADGERATPARQRERARGLSVFPVVDGGLVFVQRLREVTALHLNTGAVAWRFRADEFSASASGYLEDQPPPWDSATVHEGRLYAALPGEATSDYSYESPRSPPEVACLDARTGKTIWRVDPDSAEGTFAEVLFDSAPVIRHGRMYIVGRRRRSFGFEDCYLYRLDANTGATLQRTHLGSASTGTFGSRQATKTVTALHGDTVYVCTNLGSIAAVSAHTGTVRWLTLYERRREGVRDEGDWPERETRPWHFNPVIWSDGRLFILPTDSRRLLVLRADDGDVLQSIPTADLGHIETVLGANGDTVCGVGRDVACYDVQSGQPHWSSPLPEGSNLHGRGVWADDRLLVPTESSLCAFLVSDGSRTDMGFASEGHGGNLLALPDQLLIAGPDRLDACIRRTQIFDALRRQMAASPADPMPALELAEISLGNDEFTDAVEVLDEAVRRAEARREPNDSPVARRLFDDGLLFLDRLSARNLLTETRLDRLFTQAAAFAPDAAAHLAYRLRFAERFEARGDAPRAVHLYQQILRDRSLRELPIRPDVPDSDEAGYFAQARIAALVERHGRSIYASFDAEAAQLLERARSAGDKAALERLVATFPNAESAPLALIAEGDLLIGEGKPEPAAKCYAAAYHRCPAPADRPGLLKKIADAYGQSGNTGYAYLWLTKASREHPSVRFDDGGRRVSFLEYRERIAHARDQVEPSRPNLVPPLTARFTSRFDGVFTLLAPRFGSDPVSDWSRYFVDRSSGIEAFDPRTGERIWAEPAAVAGRVELLAAMRDAAVFATGYEIFALDAATGTRRWSYGEPPKHLERPDADWEDEPADRAFAMQGNRLVAVRSDGRLTCLAIDTGREVWSRTHRPVPVGRVHLADAWVVYPAVRDDRVTINLIDADTGAWVDAIATDERRAVEDLIVTLDGRIILVTSQSIASYDPQSRRRRWRIAPGGHIRPGSWLPDLDALYFSADGRSLQKVSLDDGRTLWESERFARGIDDEWSVQRQDASIIVSTTSFIAAIDAVTGLTLWTGATPQTPRFVARLLTKSYVVAVDVPDRLTDADASAYFYDHRHASGLIPRDGGAPNLGRLAEVRAVTALDGALLVQTESTIEGWAHE